MHRIVKLSDLANLPYPEGYPNADRYTIAEQDAARRHWEAQGLRYDCKTGVTRSDSFGEHSRYVSASDIPDYGDDLDGVLWDAFMGEIRNSCSRKRRGLDF